MNKFWNWIKRTVRDDAGETSEETKLLISWLMPSFVF